MFAGEEAGQFAKYHMFEVSLVSVVDDGYDSNFAVGLDELGIAVNGSQNIFFVSSDQGLHFTAELEISSLEVGGDDGLVLARHKQL